MSKKLEKLERLVNKLQTRYGASDPDVARLSEEVGALRAFELHERTGLDKRWRSTDFQTPARKIQNFQLGDQHSSAH